MDSATVFLMAVIRAAGGELVIKDEDIITITENHRITRINDSMNKQVVLKLEDLS